MSAGLVADSAASFVGEVLLSAGTVEGIVTRCERWLEKRSSRPPPNSILRDIVLDSVDMILWVQKSVVMWFPEDNVWYSRT